MSTGHSWKWLAPRLSTEQVRNSARAAASADNRPCLPMVEELGDRLMLSSEGVPPPPNSLAGILIGLIKGEIKGEVDGDSLLEQEGGLLKLAGAQLKLDKHVGGIKWEDFHRFAGDIIKFDDPITRFVEDVMSGKSPSVEKAQEELSQNYLKIQEFAKKLDASGNGGEGNQGRAGDLAMKLSDTAIKLLGSLNDLGPVIKLRDDYKFYVKLADSFGDASNGVLKLHEDLLANKAIKGETEYLKIKLQDILVSSLKLTDPSESLKSAITDGVAEINSLADGSVKPEFSGGVATTNTGDVLK